MSVVPVPETAPICDACFAKYQGWLEYRPRIPIRLHHIGKPLNLAERAEDTYSLIRQQQDAIRSLCHSQQHVDFVAMQLELWTAAS